MPTFSRVVERPLRLARLSARGRTSSCSSRCRTGGAGAGAGAGVREDGGPRPPLTVAASGPAATAAISVPVAGCFVCCPLAVSFPSLFICFPRRRFFVGLAVLTERDLRVTSRDIVVVVFFSLDYLLAQRRTL